jgi:hypothetical protein
MCTTSKWLGAWLQLFLNFTLHTVCLVKVIYLVILMWVSEALVLSSMLELLRTERHEPEQRNRYACIGMYAHVHLSIKNITKHRATLQSP